MASSKTRPKEVLQNRLKAAEEELTTAFLKNRKQFKKNPKRRLEFIENLLEKFNLKNTSVERYMFFKWMCVLKRVEWPVTLQVRN